MILDTSSYITLQTIEIVIIFYTTFISELPQT